MSTPFDSGTLRRWKRSLWLTALVTAGVSCSGADNSRDAVPTTRPVTLNSAPIDEVASNERPDSESITVQTAAAAAVRDGLVVTAGVPMSDFNQAPHIASLGDGFVKVQRAVDGVVGVSTSDDGQTWRDIESDLEVAFIETIGSDGHRIVVIGYDASGEQATPWISVDGGSTWTALALPEAEEPVAEFVTASRSVETVAVAADRILMVGRESSRVDWRAYSISVLGQDHGSPRGEGGDPNSWTVSFEDGFEVTVDMNALGLPADQMFPAAATVFVHNGTEWLRRQSQWFDGGLGGFEIAVGPAGFVSIVRSGSINGPPTNQGFEAQVSLDGAVWQAHALPAELNLTGASVIGGPLGYVAIGNEGLYHSLDGAEWTKVHAFEDLDPSAMMSPPASRPSAGIAGFVVPVIDGVGATPTARLFWSRDGTAWSEDQLPGEVQGFATAVSTRLALVVPFVAGDPTESMPTLPADDADLTDVLAGAFHTDEPFTTEGGIARWTSWVSKSEALCISEGLIDALGGDRLRELRVGVFPWSLLGYGLVLPIELDDAQRMVETFRACSPDWELLMITTLTSGTEIMSERSARCVQLALDDDIAEEIFVIELARPYDDEPTAAGPDLSHLESAIGILEECLTDQELNAIDFD